MNPAFQLKSMTQLFGELEIPYGKEMDTVKQMFPTLQAIADARDNLIADTSHLLVPGLSSATQWKLYVVGTYVAYYMDQDCKKKNEEESDEENHGIWKKRDFGWDEFREVYKETLQWKKFSAKVDIAEISIIPFKDVVRTTPNKGKKEESDDDEEDDMSD